MKKNKDSFCDTCFRAKQTRCPFTNSESKADGLFDLIHCDIWDSYKAASFCRAHYFLSIMDDAGWATWVYLMAHKTNVFPLLWTFVSFVEKQFEAIVKFIRTNNGLEFKEG